MAATLAAVATLALAQPLHAVPFSTEEIGNYLLIGMGPVNTINARPGVGQAISDNNYEIGAIKAPVPSVSGFASGSSGPGIRGNSPNIPENAKAVQTGVFNDGNVAVTHSKGVFNFQDLGVYADLGIRCAQSVGGCDVGTQNSFWNDPKKFPNTFTVTGNGGTKNNNVDGTGTFVGPGAADQSTRIDKPTSAGVTGNFNFSSLLAEIANADSVIQSLAATAVLDVSKNGGKLTKIVETGGSNPAAKVVDLAASGIALIDAMIKDGRTSGSYGDNTNDVGNTVIRLGSGLNIIDIKTGKTGEYKDFLLEETSLVIDGPEDAFAIFRVPDTANFLVSNANILVGEGGIGLNNVLFWSDKPDDNQHFKFSNSVLNGVAFWTTGYKGGEINLQNVQGCTQLIGDQIYLSNVRINRCDFGTTQVPEPGALSLLALGLLGLGAMRRRRAH